MNPDIIRIYFDQSYPTGTPSLCIKDGENLTIAYLDCQKDAPFWYAGVNREQLTYLMEEFRHLLMGDNEMKKTQGNAYNGKKTEKPLTQQRGLIKAGNAGKPQKGLVKSGKQGKC